MNCKKKIIADQYWAIWPSYSLFEYCIVLKESKGLLDSVGPLSYYRYIMQFKVIP